jgi:Protein of unknown function DUF86
MLPEARAYLHDIEQATILIDKFRQSAAAFGRRAAVGNRRRGRKQAVACRSDDAARLTGRRRIIALRNILIHGYASVDHRVIWNILDQDVPALQSEAGRLLAE